MHLISMAYYPYDAFWSAQFSLSADQPCTVHVVVSKNGHVRADVHATANPTAGATPVGMYDSSWFGSDREGQNQWSIQGDDTNAAVDDGTRAIWLESFPSGKDSEAFLLHATHPVYLQMNLTVAGHIIAMVYPTAVLDPDWADPIGAYDNSLPEDEMTSWIWRPGHEVAQRLEG